MCVHFNLMYRFAGFQCPVDRQLNSKRFILIFILKSTGNRPKCLIITILCLLFSLPFRSFIANIHHQNKETTSGNTKKTSAFAVAHSEKQKEKSQEKS